MKNFTVLFLAIFCCKEIKAAGLKSIDSIGAHYPIITFEKNENPQNIMVIYTKLDQDCRFTLNPKNSKEPLFDFYWLMDRKKYKPVHSLIKLGIRRRLELRLADDFQKNRQEFSTFLNDLKELKTDLKAVLMTISAQKIKTKCEVQASMTLGPVDKNSVLQIESIYTQAVKTFLPPFRKVTSVTLIGKNASTGVEMKKTYSRP